MSLVDAQLAWEKRAGMLALSQNIVQRSFFCTSTLLAPLCPHASALFARLSPLSAAENELTCLEMIHLFVEVLDKYFSNVCELDLVWHFNKACSPSLERFAPPRGLNHIHVPATLLPHMSAQASSKLLKVPVRLCPAVRCIKYLTRWSSGGRFRRPAERRAPAALRASSALTLCGIRNVIGNTRPLLVASRSTGGP